MYVCTAAELDKLGLEMELWDSIEVDSGVRALLENTCGSEYTSCLKQRTLSFEFSN